MGPRGQGEDPEVEEEEEREDGEGEAAVGAQEAGVDSCVVEESRRGVGSDGGAGGGGVWEGGHAMR